LERSEVFDPVFLTLTPKPSKTGVFFTQKQEIISELISELFLQNFCEFEKTRIFPKNFQTSKTELFRNSQKQKVLKILSNAGPYLRECTFVL